MRLPCEDQLPSPGDVAEIVLIDLQTGKERVVAKGRRGLDTQLGAQVQWGATDHQLFFNDLDATTWRPCGVKAASPLGAQAQSWRHHLHDIAGQQVGRKPCLLRIGATQPGYGIIVPQDQVPINRGAPAEDGLYITDTSSGECKLLVSRRKSLRLRAPP